MLVTHANKYGFDLTPLSGDHHGYMPPMLKTKQILGHRDFEPNFEKVVHCVAGRISP